ncbi:MAG: SDR family oxidoreductase [Porticoccaceae bacterium]|nr:SDR family oxidoreductase [Porticoccaceae bacterium]
MPTPFDKFSLSGKTALVTGGATGLGLHMSRAIGQCGARVLIAARREDVLRRACEELMADPFIDLVSWRTVDLGDRQSVDALAQYATSEFGGVDIFIGNAAGTYTEQLEDIDFSTVDDGFQANVIANMQLAKAFLPGMRERKWGRFIFSSSIASTMVGPREGTATYSATKSALNSFNRVIATDMGHDNITANTLLLGFFETDILSNGIKHIENMQGPEAARKFVNDFVSVTALGRFGDPAEIEGLIQLLASDAGSYITGASISIDGGMSVMMRPLPVS